MRKLRALEDVLIRVESALAVVLVLTMLSLAAYNVVYRNVLVQLQQHWAHSGPVPEPALVPGAVKSETSPEAQPGGLGDEPKPDAKAAGDDFGGFGGGLDEPEPKAAGDDFGGFGGGLDEPEPPAKVEPDAKAASDDFGGFGGGLDEPEPDPPAKVVPAPAAPAVVPPASASDDFGGFGGGLDEPEPPAKVEPDAKAASDDFGGFGGGMADDAAEPASDDFGGFGGEAKAPAASADDDLGEDDLGEDDLGDDGDPFANLADIDASGKQDANVGPQGGPPPEGSFAAWAVGFIDDIKLDWIDILLRQLVIIVAFLGAMLATHRGKHINIDALSKILPPKLRRVVVVVLPAFAVAVCLMFARAGWDLVQISREYPKDLLPSVPEWAFQLMFPVGFGLLAVHFTVRVVEAVVDAPAPEAPTPKPETGAPAPEPRAESESPEAKSESPEAEVESESPEAEAESPEAEAESPEAEAESPEAESESPEAESEASAPEASSKQGGQG